jgi:hypothetical protein
VCEKQFLLLRNILVSLAFIVKFPKTGNLFQAALLSGTVVLCFADVSLHYGDVLQPAGKQVAVILGSEGNALRCLAHRCLFLHKWGVAFSLLRTHV